MTVIETCMPSQVSSYIADDEGGSIMFLPCGVISFDRNDVRERYWYKMSSVHHEEFRAEHSRRS